MIDDLNVQFPINQPALLWNGFALYVFKGQKHVRCRPLYMTWFKNSI